MTVADVHTVEKQQAAIVKSKKNLDTVIWGMGVPLYSHGVANVGLRNDRKTDELSIRAC